jgi:hypothetical protein
MVHQLIERIKGKIEFKVLDKGGYFSNHFLEKINLSPIIRCLSPTRRYQDICNGEKIALRHDYNDSWSN